jgi:hypothetical protein
MRLLALALVLVGPACATTGAAPRTSEEPGKPTAPVTVDAVLSPGHARVTLHFDAAASRVSAGVRGLDGLRVTPPAALPRTEWGKGETAVLEVALGEPTGTLAVFVSGATAGNPWSRAVSFAVGALPGSEEGGVAPTDLGPVKVMPAGR